MMNSLISNVNLKDINLLINGLSVSKHAIAWKSKYLTIWTKLCMY